MSTQPKPSEIGRSSADRTRAYRDRLRAQGLKPRTIWTYDVNDPVFIEAVRKASLASRDDPAEREVMDWMQALQAEDGRWD